MQPVVLRPDPAQRTIWIVELVVAFLVIFAVFMFPVLAARTADGGAAFSFIGAVLLIFALFVLAWIPLYFKSLVYEIDRGEVRVSSGVIWKRRVTVPYSKMTNVDVTRGPLERLFGIGRVKIQTAGYGGRQGQRPEQALVGMKQVDQVRDLVMGRIDGSNRSSGDLGDASSITSHTPAETLEAILEELSAIRSLLESRTPE